MADEAGFEIGRAFVSVDPDAADFDEKLAEQIGSPVVIVRVQADAADVDAQIDEQVGHHSTTVTVDANTGPAREQVDELVSSGLPKNASFAVDADTAPAKSALEELSGTKVDVDTAPAKASLAELGGAADEAQAQLDKISQGATAAGEAMGTLGADSRGAAEELSSSSPEVQHFGEQFSAVAQELREFGEAAGGIAGSTADLDAALGRIGFALEGIHASGAVAVGELIALQGELTAIEGQLDTMEGAFGTAAGAIGDIGHAAVTSAGEVEGAFGGATDGINGVARAATDAAGQVDVLNGDLATGGSRDASGGYYKTVADDIGGVAHSSEQAAQAQRDLRTGVNDASEAFTGLAQEMGQLDHTVVGSYEDWGDFKKQVSGLAYDLESLQLNPTAQGLEDINMRLTAAGHAVDEFEQSIPGAVQGLGDLAGAASDGRIKTASEGYRNVEQEIADMGAAADVSAGKVGNLSGAAHDGTDVWQMFNKAVTAVIMSPWTWATAGVIAVGALTYVMTTGRSELDEYTDALQRQYHATGDNLTGYQHYDQAIRNGGQAQQELAHNTEQVSEAMARFGTSAGHATTNTHDITEAQRAAAQETSDLSGHLSTLEDRYHLTQQQAYDLVSASKASKSALAESGSAANEAMQKIEAYGQANAHAQGPVGQMSHDMDVFGNDTLTASNRVGALDDAFNRLVGNFVGSQQAQLQVQSDFLTIASNAKQAGANMDGANQASNTLQQSFYSSIQDIEGAADAMTKEGDSTQQVTQYINDQIQKLSTFTGSNQQARQAVQDLKQWEDNLHTAADGTTSAVAKESQTLQNQFIVQVKEAGVQSNTAHGDVVNLTTAIKNTGTTSNATHADRAQLIADLEASGVKASTAKADVDRYIQSLGKIPSRENTAILVTGKGQWSVTESNIYPTPSGKAPNPLLHPNPPKAAAGMLVTGGTPGKDSVLISAMPGEVVVPAAQVNAGAVDHLRGTIPGFAAGGVVAGAGVSGSFGGKASGAGSWADTESAATNNAVITSVEKAMANAINSKIAAAKAAAAHAGPAGHVSGSAGQVQALAQRMAAARGWTGALWNDLNAVEMREAGWNLNAQNPGSDAYGIAQFINGASEYAQYGGSSGTAAGQITGFLNYVAQRYGNPANALAHEIKYGWYDQGGMLQPGATLAMNNTGQPEMVLPPAVTSALTSSTGPISQLTQSLNNPAGGVDGLQKALVDPGGPMAYLQRTIANPGGPMVQLQKAVANPAGPMVKLQKAAVDPGGPMAKLGKTIADPGGPMVNLKSTIANPGGPMVGLKTTIADPGGPMVQLAYALRNFNPGGKEKGTGGGSGSGVNPGGLEQAAVAPKRASATNPGGRETGTPVYQTINVNYNGTKPSPEEHQAAMIRLSAAIGVA